jgi:hypothetical protein
MIQYISLAHPCPIFMMTMLIPNHSYDAMQAYKMCDASAPCTCIPTEHSIILTPTHLSITTAKVILYFTTSLPNHTATEMSNLTYNLQCLIEGNNRSFLIIAPHSSNNTTIGQVKQLIIEECLNHILQGVESCNLILKKVSYNMSSKSSQI